MEIEANFSLFKINVLECEVENSERNDSAFVIHKIYDFGRHFGSVNQVKNYNHRSRNWKVKMHFEKNCYSDIFFTLNGCQF